MQDFIKEWLNYLEKRLAKDTQSSRTDNKWNNLLADDLEIDNQKIILKFKDEMLLERANILQDYAQKTKDNGEMYYIYNIDADERDVYNLCICNQSQSHEVIKKKSEELPEGADLGSVLRKKGENFTLDKNGTQDVQKQINSMISEEIKKQKQYLDSKRIEGHIYEIDEKYSGRIWLYDLSNKSQGGIEGIEEIEFPKDLYENAQKGDKFIYQNGAYLKY